MSEDLSMKCGLEIHVQVDTNSKLFCQCPTNYKDVEPNTNICPVCIGHPGAKPMPPNKKAIDVAIMVAKMLDCEMVIDKDIYFQRKHYNYPDLPSGYQKTSVPIGEHGTFLGVGITEVHLEEDPGQYKPDLGTVDYNRSGTPLIEIVTDPDMKSPEEAREFLRQLMRLFRYIGHLRGEGTMRADTNISIKYNGIQGNRVEVKNVNSIRGVYKVLKYELIRQKNVLRRGGEIKMETRAFMESQMITKGMRSKETADDYRYIPDPDLQPIVLNNNWVEKVEAQMPETPMNKEKRFVEQYGIKEDDAKVLVSDLELADVFEKVVAELGNDKNGISLAVTWIRNELKRVLVYNKIEFFETNLKPEHMVELINSIKDKTISQKIGKTIIEQMVEHKGEKTPKELITEMGLTVIEDTSELEKACEEAIKNSEKAVEDYKSGNQRALNSVVGQVMKLTRGRAEPGTVVKILKKKIDG
ncbi:Asp-tRNA(Asn)/Glu-tRNA(Gln) amidotransferase subunit GatB [Methanococcus maripaludis]|uniref:Aspartyl/glutamyl-tRNA(Asn/Gln) amidotransferase subunit B n=1 Tax=Methanococcus maripaludis (strain DSM 14266 / JCM 13030 / NBRC 101832 / S2 / LL) TaxID=267377 RepID=GATB_METMP|nr:Asp-tRNA(Asn)/Glu-tRNA(Gln) amidotransferase subunit GatB [Methanococcus maripaludis]P61350.1 RecName: Full=Aspartyl/glutamyl-tRNA(Asn/Gln) amidotransferase subunit B; Short=Asp/Glu-ADT subunit B [Methanococcus maripaludis S2]CAF30502.1 Asp-tRNAAsn/Glu-tRNAGln amidotransferase subunit B [Methanococcus maripaludis S2]